MQLDRGLLGAEARPREHRQAEVDGGGVQGVHSAVQIESERLVGVHRARDVDQHLSEIGVDAPVVRLVGVGQRRSRHLAAKTHVIELALHGAQAGFDVAETFAECQLGKSQAKELIQAGKAAQFVITAVPHDALVELVRRDVINQLGEDGAAGKHAPLSEREADEVRTGQKPSAEVHIEKSRKRIYKIEYTLVPGRFKSDSRTAVIEGLL